MPEQKNSKRRYRTKQPVESLQPNTGFSRVELLVLRRYPRRHVNGRTYQGPVAAACARDETGVVGLVLWNEQVDRVRTGDLISIEAGWCQRQDGRLVLSTGRHGRLHIIRPARGWLSVASQA